MKTFHFRKYCFCLLFVAYAVQSQTFIPSYGKIVGKCSQSEIITNLKAFETLGIKSKGTQAQSDALAWIKNKYRSFGYSAAQIQEDPYSYSGSDCKNLIITKTGTKFPDTLVIIDGHYDTRNGPGTNDNGSGTVLILEIARLLANVPTEYSIKFIHFSGEEDGLLGSRHYVEKVVNATNPKMKIKLVFNIDQIGGVAGANNDTVNCERDEDLPDENNAASDQITKELMTCVGLYSSLKTKLSHTYASDYIPFGENGEVTTGLYRQTNRRIRIRLQIRLKIWIRFTYTTLQKLRLAQPCILLGLVLIASNQSE